jgi:uncharacterized membrane protein
MGRFVMGKKLMRRLSNRRQWLLGAIATAGFIFGITSTAHGEQQGEAAGDGGAVSGHVAKEGAAVEGLTVRIFRKAERPAAHAPAHRSGGHRLGQSLEKGDKADATHEAKGEHEGDAKKYEAVTDASGGFSFDHLPAGKWAILCESGGGYRAWKVVTVDAGQAVDATLNLEKSKAPESKDSQTTNGNGHANETRSNGSNHEPPSGRK